jgi:UDP-glucose 4-epimerase
MTDFNNQNVVVTGGAGFIGSHLTNRLLKSGARVLVIDDLSSCGSVNIDHFNGDPNFALEEADVRDGEAMALLLRNADTVFHLATRNVRLSLHRPTEVHEVNTIGTYNLLKAAAGRRVKRFIYCSSSEVHGDALELPLREESPCNPKTIYGASKLAGEYYTSAFHRSGWLDAIIVRPHNTYGPRAHFHGHHGEVIPRFILLAQAGLAPTIFGDGKQTRDFTYVGDTVEFMARLALHPDTPGGTYNICRGAAVSVLELAEHIIQITGLSAALRFKPERPSDIARLWGDPSRLSALLSDSPQTNLQDGLALTIEWFRKQVSIDEALADALENASWENADIEPWLAGED